MGGTHRDAHLGPVDISGASWAALAQLFPDAGTDVDLNRRLLGDEGERFAVVQVLTRREEEAQLGTLTLLARDASAKVRRAVAHGLAHWLVYGVAVPGSPSATVRRRLANFTTLRGASQTT